MEFDEQLNLAKKIQGLAKTIKWRLVAEDPRAAAGLILHLEDETKSLKRTLDEEL